MGIALGKLDKKHKASCSREKERAPTDKSANEISLLFASGAYESLCRIDAGAHPWQWMLPSLMQSFMVGQSSIIELCPLR